MGQHEPAANAGRVVGKYDFDTLGAPFKVFLYDSVVMHDDPLGEERVEIPDLVGLLSEIVRVRVTHNRKMSGADLKFIRNYLELQSNKVADFLDMSPEHYSRCENGGKVLSSPAERLLRFFAYTATFYKEPSELLEQVSQPQPKDNVSPKDQSQAHNKMLAKFFKMKIKPVYDSSEVLVLSFWRKPDRFRFKADDTHSQNVDEYYKWSEEVAA